MFIIMSAISLLVLPQVWVLAILGAILAGAGMAWVGYTLWGVKEQEVLQPAGC